MRVSWPGLSAAGVRFANGGRESLLPEPIAPWLPLSLGASSARSRSHRSSTMLLASPSSRFLASDPAALVTPSHTLFQQPARDKIGARTPTSSPASRSFEPGRPHGRAGVRLHACGPRGSRVGPRRAPPSPLRRRPARGGRPRPLPEGEPRTARPGLHRGGRRRRGRGLPRLRRAQGPALLLAGDRIAARRRRLPARCSGCSSFAADLAYVESQFRWLGPNWAYHLLAVSILYFLAAYRFDSRAVLTLALTSFAAWRGVEVGMPFLGRVAETGSPGLVRANAIGCGAPLSRGRGRFAPPAP